MTRLTILVLVLCGIAGCRKPQPQTVTDMFKERIPPPGYHLPGEVPKSSSPFLRSMTCHEGEWSWTPLPDGRCYAADAASSPKPQVKPKRRKKASSLTQAGPYFLTKGESDIVFQPSPPMPTVMIGGDRILEIDDVDHKLLVYIDTKGNVDYGDGYVPDAAARIFWETLAKDFPQACQVYAPDVVDQ